MNYAHEVKKIESTKKLESIFQEFIGFAKSILEDFNNRTDATFSKAIFHQLFQRMYISLKAIGVLLHEFKRNRYFKYSIAIQMRVCMLDSLTICYLFKYAHTDQFRKKLARFNVQFIEELVLEIDNLKVEVHEKIRNYKWIVDAYPDNLDMTDNRATPKENIRRIGAKTMSKDVIDELKDVAFCCFTLYSYYSKYEHYGLVSKNMLEHPDESDFDKMITASFMAMQTANIALTVMEDANSENVKQIKKVIVKYAEIMHAFAKAK
jgi:hypothetical protein